jgi:hypothetical protein
MQPGRKEHMERGLICRSWIGQAPLLSELLFSPVQWEPPPSLCS